MKPMPPAELWTSLTGSPLFGLSLTLVAYLAGVWLFKRSGQKPLCNPVLISAGPRVARVWKPAALGGACGIALRTLGHALLPL